MSKKKKSQVTKGKNFIKQIEEPKFEKRSKLFYYFFLLSLKLTLYYTLSILKIASFFLWPGFHQSNESSYKNDMSSSNNNNNNDVSSSNTRLPLSEVVSDCVKRWFKDTLKEAKAGDINMQILVAQMYYSGYGISRDAQKVYFS